MSHRAIVAIENGDAYNVYYSHNGADELNLLVDLEEFATEYNAGSSSGVDRLNLRGSKPHDSELSVPVGPDADLVNFAAMQDRIDPDPIDVGVPLYDVGKLVEMDDIRAVYVVRDGGVETYAPVWVYTNAIRRWRQALTVRVREELLPSPEELLEMVFVGEVSGGQVIDGSVLGSPDWPGDEHVRKIVRDQHENIFAQHRRGVDLGDGQAIPGALLTEDGCINVEGPSEQITPTPAGRGLLVRVDSLDGLEAVERFANQARFDIGVELNEMDEVDKRTLAEAEKEFVKAVVTEYPNQVAEFCPHPFDALVELYRPEYSEENSESEGVA